MWARVSVARPPQAQDPPTGDDTAPLLGASIKTRQRTEVFRTHRAKGPQLGVTRANIDLWPGPG